jgi:hypothetical protein
VTRIENMLDNQRGSDLTLQVQSMERELQRLRGLVEQQKYELEGLKRSQGGAGPVGDSRLSGPAGQGARAGEPAVDQAATPAAPVPAREQAPAAGGRGGETARGRGVKGTAPYARRGSRITRARGDAARRGDPASSSGAGGPPNRRKASRMPTSRPSSPSNSGVSRRPPSP